MQVILYTKDFDKTVTAPVDVILSPQFYWIKKIDVPVKSKAEAKKIAKNLFDLDEKAYHYDAIFLGDIYFAVAIKKDLRLSIEKKYIRSIRLAQTELFDYECINVSKNHSIKKVEDILFCFPHNDSCPEIDAILPTLKLSKHTIDLYNRIDIDRVSIALLFVGMLFISITFLLQGFEYKKALQTLEAKKETLHTKYHLPTSSYALDAILKKYKKIDAHQTKLRKDLAFFSRAPVQRFESLQYDGKVYDITARSDKNLDSYFKKRFTILSSRFQKNIYTAKLTHE